MSRQQYPRSQPPQAANTPPSIWQRMFKSDSNANVGNPQQSKQQQLEHEQQIHRTQTRTKEKANYADAYMNSYAAFYSSAKTPYNPIGAPPINKVPAPPPIPSQYAKPGWQQQHLQQQQQQQQQPPSPLMPTTPTTPTMLQAPPHPKAPSSNTSNNKDEDHATIVLHTGCSKSTAKKALKDAYGDVQKAVALVRHKEHPKGRGHESGCTICAEKEWAKAEQEAKFEADLRAMAEARRWRMETAIPGEEHLAAMGFVPSGFHAPRSPGVVDPNESSTGGSDNGYGTYGSNGRARLGRTNSSNGSWVS